MEEMFELLLVVICAVIGIAAKASKNKKKAGNTAAGVNISAGIEKLNDILGELADDEDYDVPDVEIPAVPPQPAAVMPQQMVMDIPPVHAPEEDFSVEGDCNHPLHAPVIVPRPVPTPMTRPAQKSPTMEGDCDHPLHEPVVVPRPKPRVRAAADAPALQLERLNVHKNTSVSGKVTAAQLRQAVIMSEVLGKPAALKGAYRR